MFLKKGFESLLAMKDWDSCIKNYPRFDKKVYTGNAIETVFQNLKVRIQPHYPYCIATRCNNSAAAVYFMDMSQDSVKNDDSTNNSNMEQTQTSSSEDDLSNTSNQPKLNHTRNTHTHTKCANTATHTHNHVCILYVLVMP